MSSKAPHYRPLWFRLWVDLVCPAILWVQYRILVWGCPSRPKTSGPWPDADVRAARLWPLIKAIVALRTALVLSWFYHRSLDIAGWAL